MRRDWYVVDAAGKTLGRLATELARRLRGKHKPEYTPHVDTGDYLVVINASQVRVTGNKLNGKIYYRPTGYIGNMKQESLGDLMKRAVKGMLPKTKLGRVMLSKLKIHAGPCPEHGYVAQKAEKLDL